MTNARFVVLVLLGLAFVGIGLSAFTVNERELAIKLRLGEVVETGYDPGLYWKIPVYHNIRKFEKRIMTIQDRPERIFTAERRALQVDFFVKWRIVDAVNFYTSTGGFENVANDRLSEIIKNAIVTEFGKRSVQQAISVDRAELKSTAMTNARFVVLVLLGLAFVGIGLSAFTVNERELAIKLRLGEVVETGYDPGLYWKIPVYHNIRKFEKRIMTIQDRPERIFTDCLMNRHQAARLPNPKRDCLRSRPSAAPRYAAGGPAGSGRCAAGRK